MTLFKIPCRAETAEQARLVTFEQHQRDKVSWIRDNLDTVRHALEDKQVRAAENPGLYGDKLAEYERALARIAELYESPDSPELCLIEALELNGDVRLADRSRVCALWTGGDNWIIFGVP